MTALRGRYDGARLPVCTVSLQFAPSGLSVVENEEVVGGGSAI